MQTANHDKHRPGVAYLSNRYPAISHTFILREVVGLRALGMRIETMSVNRPDRPFDKLTPEEQQEASRTTYLKSAGAMPRHMLTLLKLALTRPDVMFRAARSWCRYGEWDLKVRLKAAAYLGEALLVGDWMEREGLDHIHGHFGGAVTLICMFAAESFGKTYSFTIHGPNEYMDLAWTRIETKAQRSKFVIAISEFGRAHLLRLLGMENRHKLHAVHLGVDLKMIPTGAHVAAAGEPVQLLCVGRMVREKAQDVLLEAFAKLVHRGVNARLTLVGDGPYMKQFRQLVAELELGDYVTFTGALNQPQTFAQMGQADIFVLPSFAEGIPVALMEAMAMEVPCISTAITGIPELIRSGTDGVLVQPGDVEALAEAMHALILNPELRSRLGRAGRVKVAEHFNLEINVPRLHRLFAQHGLPSAELPQAPVTEMQPAVHTLAEKKVAS